MNGIRSLSQADAGIIVKFSPSLKEKLGSIRPFQSSEYIIAASDKTDFLNLLKQLDKTMDVHIVYAYHPAAVFILRANWRDILNLVRYNEVLFIDEKRKAIEELLVGNYDLGTNKVNTVHHQYPQWNGNNMVLSVKENKPDTIDLDLQGRFLATSLASAIYSPHATIMATIAAGAGNSFYQGKGAAWSATISSSSFATLLPDADAAYSQYNISVQNHSYGTGIENYYGADSRAFDQNSINNPALLHVFSAGNSGLQTNNSGPYANVPLYANLTGSFKMAKNIITIGHVDSLYHVLAPSSKGPAYDGRVKPELVAFGEDGSSGAAALVSGISLLLQHAYKERHAGIMPASSMVKALLLNSADDVDTPGIDFSSGYGNVNAYNAMSTLINEQFLAGTISNGSSNDHVLVIPSEIKKMKLTLVWNDPPASANAAKALVNDLDIELILPAISQSWQPWVLNSFPHKDSLVLLPKRKKDTLNNVEQITVDDPVAGNYIIRITGSRVTSSSQIYSLAWQLDTAAKFTWYYPTGSDNIFPSDTNTLRWESGFNASGLLEYYTSGNTWQIISANVDLSRGYYQWVAPDTHSLSRLRMTVNGNSYTTDSFTITKPLNTHVGFNCPDSFLFYWNKIPGISNYQVYRLGTKFLEPLQVVADTFIVLSKSGNLSMHYAVAPLLQNKQGVKSLTFDYRTQGVECYVKSFLVSLINNTASLNLELGTNYKIQKLTWEKLATNGYIPLNTITAINGVHFNYTDGGLTKGVNSYRVKIELSNGQLIYSNIETIFYFPETEYIIFPNPSLQSQPLTIISKEVNSEKLQVYNSVGVLVYETILDDIRKVLPSGRLTRGVYFIKVIKANSHTTSLRFVIY